MAPLWIAAPGGCTGGKDDPGGSTGSESDPSGFTGGEDDPSESSGPEGEAVKDRMISLWWSGAAEEVGIIDLMTGMTTPVGELGDLERWSGETALSSDGTMLYALGQPSMGGPERTMYVFDLEADTLAYQLPDAFGSQTNVVLAGFDHQSRMIGAWWSGSAEEVITIDPETGATAVLGQLGDLERWQSETALSADGTMLYALGYPENEEGPVWTLYAFDLQAETFAYQVVDVFDPQRNVVLAGFDHLDRLVAMWWSGTAEEVITIDPVTGAVTVVGQLGDLLRWSGQTALSDDGTMLYALGYPDEQNIEWTMYAFDLGTDALAYQVANHAALSQNVILAGFAQ